ncbi:MAG TPA: hypothetical protein VFZ00_21050 [Solirubrobacter sp.]|nr:hypothetical protein [Solirubrobacter sp.]
MNCVAVHEAVIDAGLSFEAPTYVYDLGELHARCARLERALPAAARVFFATMANDHPVLLGELRERGHGVFVNSPRHLELALATGFEPSQVLYAATNMLAREMRATLASGARLVIDSIGQLRTLAEVAPPSTRVELRVDVGSALDGGQLAHEPGYRFGVLPSELSMAARIATASGVTIGGVHAYFGTDVMSVDVLLDGLERLCGVLRALPAATTVDVAGGLGVGDGLSDFDLEGYGLGAAAILERWSSRLDRALELVIEPGRWLAATCGHLFVTVVDVKRRATRTFVGTNGSVAIFPRPLMYPDRARHPCGIVGEHDRPEHVQPIWVCGNSTYSRDFLAAGIRMALPRPGERLVIGNAGAYSRSMITEFLGKPRPAEICLPSDGAGAGEPDALRDAARR